MVAVNDGVLVKLDAATRMLQEATTPAALKSVVDIAAAAEIYAKRQKLGDEAISYAHCIKTDALRRLGEMLKATPKATGGQPYRATCSNAEQVETLTPTIQEFLGMPDDPGAARKISMVAQQLAALPEEEVEAIKAGETTLTKARRRQTAERIKKEVSAPTAKYRVIYADPPWSYGNTQPDYQTEQRDYYPVMSLAEICAIPVRDWCEENAVLFLWTTSPMLEECFDVIRAWGFRYKASFVWDKVKHNMGHYNSVRHEFLLICVRGSCQPDVPKLYDSVVVSERKAHSAKPSEFVEIIDTLYPHGKRLEMFARAQRDGWDAWGNQANG